MILKVVTILVLEELSYKKGGGISNGSDGINKKLKEGFYHFKNIVLAGRNIRKFADKTILKVKRYNMLLK